MSVTLERPVETGLLRFLALDLTRTCQAQCTHCYNQSSPSGTHGEMTREDWLSLLDQAAAAGVTQVQFIGGEPTLHPDIADLINKAVEHAMAVEVFSNLIHVRATLWPVLRQRGVTLATSYYSDQAAEHEAVTAHRGSYAKTKANITKALAYGIPLRAAIVDVREGQRIDQAITELREMGVQRIRTDRLRKIGRGDNTGQDTHEITELCGHCAKGRAAVLPDGSVAGCVMSGGMMTTGSVRTTPSPRSSPARNGTRSPPPSRSRAAARTADAPRTRTPASPPRARPNSPPPGTPPRAGPTRASPSTRCGASPAGARPSATSAAPSATKSRAGGNWSACPSRRPATRTRTGTIAPRPRPRRAARPTERLAQ